MSPAGSARAVGAARWAAMIASICVEDGAQARRDIDLFEFEVVPFVR